MLPPHIQDTLQKLEAAQALRQLRLPLPHTIDFSSNDYLGLARLPTPGPPDLPFGATGARLLSGHHPLHDRLETLCAASFQAPAALTFSSGYLANLGLLSAIATRHDTYLYDQAVHASLKDGMRLSHAQSQPFRHNDLHHLEELLKKASGNTFVVTEALFSMDGDLPDLQALVELAKRHGAYLILDEAHSTGIYGKAGEGLAASLGLQDRLLARIHTFGKAVGRAGAAVVGATDLRRFLINRSRPFIFTTAMPAQQAAAIIGALELLPTMQTERELLTSRRRLLESLLPIPVATTPSPIIPILIPGNAEVKAAAATLQAQSLDIRPILAPTVPLGSERLRVILHAYNTDEEIHHLAHHLRPLLP